MSTSKTLFIYSFEEGWGKRSDRIFHHFISEKEITKSEAYDIFEKQNIPVFKTLNYPDIYSNIEIKKINEFQSFK